MKIAAADPNLHELNFFIKPLDIFLLKVVK
jgi:hypothetical protein